MNPSLRQSIFVVACGVAAGLLVMWSPGLATMIMVLIAVGWLIRRWAPEADRAFIVRLYAVAIAARFLIGAALHLWAMYHGKGYLMYGYEAFDISGDSAYLSLRAWILAQVRQGRLDAEGLYQGIFHDDGTWLVHPYMWFYSVFGFSQFAAKLINSLLGALMPLIAYATTKALAGVRPAKIAAWLVAFFPSTLLWSVTDLKESPTALGLAWGCWAAVRLLQRGAWPSTLLHAAGALALVWVARPALAWPFLACLVVGSALGFLISRPNRVLIAAAGLLVVGAVVGPPHWARASPSAYWKATVDRVMNEMVSRHKGERSSGGSSYRIYDPTVYQRNDHGDRFSFSPGQIVRALVISWGYFLFSPVPWRISSALQAVALPELCAWYALMACALLGLIRLLRRRCGALMVLVVPLLVLTTFLAMSTGNMGVAFRHRGMFIPLYLTLSAAGLGQILGLNRRDGATSVRVV